ncbi:MAG TPA: hypothetical protein VHB21_04245 [Minicystis sp.]|nr:hypothetical protein [Minicystis sp.]
MIEPRRARAALSVCMIALATSACSPGRASGGAAADAGPLPSGVPTQGPAATALIDRALECKYEPTAPMAFVNCKALDEFATSRDAFLGSVEGERYLLGMLTGPDEKRAAIAATRTPCPSERHGGSSVEGVCDVARQVVADRAAAERLFTVVERNDVASAVRASAARWLGYVDFEKLGLAPRLQALAKNPSVPVRRGVARDILGVPGSAARWDLAAALLVDAAPDVRRDAAGAIGSQTTVDPRACRLLAVGVDDHDDAIVDTTILAAANARRCAGMSDRVIAYLDGKTADVSKLENAKGVPYATTLNIACAGSAAGSSTAKRCCAIAERLTDAKEPDAWTRVQGVASLPHCDAKQSTALLEKLASDPSPDVSRAARQALETSKAEHGR